MHRKLYDRRSTFISYDPQTRHLIYNWRGVAGAAVGGAGACIVLATLHVAGLHLSIAEQLCYGADLDVLISAACGLLTDRCNVPGVFACYRQLVVQFSYSVFDRPLPRGYIAHPANRLAWFVFPLALGPAFLLLFTGMAWGIDAAQGNKAASNPEYAAFFAIALTAALCTWLLAVCTKSLRRIHY